MDGRWIKRLPPVCAAGGGLLLTGTAAACARLTLGGAGDRPAFGNQAPEAAS